MRRGRQVVSIEAASDLEALEIATDAPNSEQTLIARDAGNNLSVRPQIFFPQTVFIRRAQLSE